MVKDPFGSRTVAQFIGQRSLITRDLDNDTAWNTPDATNNITKVGNKGPLLNIAMAQFGEGSFVDVQHTALPAYAKSGMNCPAWTRFK